MLEGGSTLVASEVVGVAGAEVSSVADPGAAALEDVACAPVVSVSVAVGVEEEDDASTEVAVGIEEADDVSAMLVVGTALLELLTAASEVDSRL